MGHLSPRSHSCNPRAPLGWRHMAVCSQWGCGEGSTTRAGSAQHLTKQSWACSTPGLRGAAF
jgi:hypothetical protein